MLKTKQILVSAFVLAVSVFNLVACGQTGSLYLPTRSTPVKQAAGTDATTQIPKTLPTKEETTGPR